MFAIWLERFFLWLLRKRLHSLKSTYQELLCALSLDESGTVVISLPLLIGDVLDSLGLNAPDDWGFVMGDYGRKLHQSLQESSGVSVSGEPSFDEERMES